MPGIPVQIQTAEFFAAVQGRQYCADEPTGTQPDTAYSNRIFRK